MASTDELGLTTFRQAQTSGYEDSGINSLYSRASGVEVPDEVRTSLPQADQGRQAWLFLAGSFMIECLIWGFPFSFGVFNSWYRTHEPFKSAPGGISVIGTTAMGIMYLGAPFVSAFLYRFPRQRRYVQFIGLLVMIFGLVASSFATTVWQLILTQGVIFGISGGFVYFPTIQYSQSRPRSILIHRIHMDEWFQRRKGFAFGVMWAGTGVSGVVIPFIMDWGLNKYGSATMLRAWAVVLLVMAGPLLFFVKGRIPISQTSYPRPLSYGFLKSPQFLGLQLGVILEGLGFFIPGIYLPTYAKAMGLSSIDGALLLALFNTTSVVGAVVFGTLTDRFHVTSVILISTIGATISVFLIWGFAISFPLLCIFSLMYGLFAGGYSATWTGITYEVKKRDDRAEAVLVFGVLAAGRGIGSVVSGPLSEALMSGNPWHGKAVLGYGSGYGPLVVFTGASALLGGCSWVFRRANWS